jgi:hypothetical protein
MRCVEILVKAGRSVRNPEGYARTLSDDVIAKVFEREALNVPQLAVGTGGAIDRRSARLRERDYDAISQKSLAYGVGEERK